MKNNKLLRNIMAVTVVGVMAATIVIAAIFAACEKPEDALATTTVAQEYEETTEAPPPYELTIVPAYETERIPANLPDYDWGGYTFRVLTGKKWVGSWAMLNTRDITAEQETGDAINDAVYKRNAILEGKYNFKIKQVVASDVDAMETVNKAVSSGDHSFDAASQATSSVVRRIQSGYYVDLFGVRYLDFEKPWWDQGAVRDLSIGHRLYLTSGDFVLANKDLCPAILFNKQLLADLQLENPYELVRGGKWTMGKLSEMSRAAAADLNGNGRMDIDADRFGYIHDNLPPNTYFLHGMGVRYTTKDADDMPVLIFGSERGFTAIQICADFALSDFTRYFETLFIGEDDRSGTELAFAENRGLFMGTVVTTAETLRMMDTDFGILPMPWLDESQREWGHSANNKYGESLVVPNFHDGEALERTGFMLEAIAAESRYTVIPAYYDVQLKGKFARDDESSDMLDIIFSSMVWDTGIVYDWFGFTRGIGVLRYNASSFESERGAVEAAMRKTVDAIVNLE